MHEQMTFKRLMGIDPGEKRIGISISDPSGTISRPLCTINNISYAESAQKIVELCARYEIGKIILGLSRDEDGEVTFSGRKALRLADAIRKLIEIPVEYWDEEGTTKMAQKSRQLLGVRRKDRRGHLDDVAACVLLQSYIDNFYVKVNAKHENQS